MVFSGAVILFGAPIFLLIALAVILDSGRPVFYSQRRVGKGFRPFLLHKFRSMTVNSRGPTITVSGDRRITIVGSFLRATKLDELPQFWNVLRGEMSLVGPRPELPEFVALFPERYEMVLQVQPGITDLASIEFRDEGAILARSADPQSEYVRTILPAKLDLAEEYIRRQSLWLDVELLWKTFVVVAGRR